MTTIGKVSEILRERDFVWEIEDFMSLETEENVFYDSPSFTFGGDTWCLKVYPNGDTFYQTDGFIGLYLERKSSGSPICVEFSLALKTIDESEDDDRHFIRTFKKQASGFGRSKLLSRSKLIERRAELAPLDVLSFICTMKYSKPTEDESNEETAKCSHCEKTLCADADFIALHEKRCMDKPIRCPGCYTVFKLKDWFDHECQVQRMEASSKLSEDLQAIVVSGDHSDIIIKVRDEEFLLHRCILATRSSYFHSMLKNDMKEKKTGIVTIHDCETDIFRIFVHFIYTGKVDKLISENVCELYEVADKYQEDQLKKECLHFMLEKISEDTFCDFLVLALKYDEKNLFENAVEFFTFKPKAIVRSVKWQNFLRDYPKQANELIIKMVDRNVK